LIQELQNVTITRKPKLKLISDKLKLAEFFAGTGSFSLGFEATGKFETIYANDINENSKKIYDLNFKTPLTLGDMNLITNESIPKMDIITAGVSCQPFSSAGKQLGFDDPRSDVFWRLVEIIKYHKPKIFVIENVKNLVSHDDGETIKVIIDNLSKTGYWLKYAILNTCKITRIPQNRERIYILGFLDQRVAERFQFPEAEVLPNYNIAELLESKVPTKYYYSDKLKCWDLVSQYVTKDISTNTVYQYRRTIVRENKSGVCPTLTANAGLGGHNVPLIKDANGIRKLTPLECFRLQGFPNTYKFGTLADNALYQLAGNAVTTSVVQKIAEQILKAL
jgi:DNA (cytosine-5)-methyltransferase 1